MDYHARGRLKIYAQAKIIDLNEDHKLRKQLDLKEYNFRAERIMVFDVDAYDLNCPQHITPRYIAMKINEAFVPQREHIIHLEQAVKRLKGKLDELSIIYNLICRYFLRGLPVP